MHAHIHTDYLLDNCSLEISVINHNILPQRTNKRIHFFGGGEGSKDLTLKDRLAWILPNSKYFQKLFQPKLAYNLKHICYYKADNLFRL